MAAHTSPGIDQHPDIMALRAHSERATSTPAAQAVEGLALLAGLYLAISPWIVGFSGLTTLTVNNLIAGLAFTVLTMGFVNSAYERTHGMSWAALGIGIWAIIAPWVVSGSVDTTRTIWSNCVVGGVMVLLSLATGAMVARAARRP
ncbi:SPW repeat protein [Streptomyces montanisoli]|uniref:SPW repeat protein n=1 Tax=Streptomyces montanisoli TaxID=2798581 RepID=A0A940RY76_9ACTN|nr:SPW repeat protein [Streptomyces montanisoli]MBP0461305.1 SPW repeat protein [Streptomyces montanisoli]